MRIYLDSILYFFFSCQICLASFQSLVRSQTSGYGESAAPAAMAGPPSIPPVPSIPRPPKDNMMQVPKEPPFRPPGPPEDVRVAGSGFPSMDSLFAFPNAGQMQVPPVAPLGNGQPRKPI